MRGKARILIVVAFVLFAAGVAAASNPLLAGPSPGLAVSGSTLSQSSTTGTTSTAPLGGTSPTLGATTPAPSTGTGGSLTTPVLTGQNGTTVPGITTPTPTVTSPTAPGLPAIDQVLSLTRTVEAGAPVSAFTVPAGQQLVITDILITNPAPTPACGAAVGAVGAPPTTGVIPPAAPTNGGTTTGTTTAGVTTPRAITLGEGTSATPGGITTTAATESGTGLLCVPAQTSLNLGLTTGLEFSSGQSVQLGNAAPAAATPGGPLHYHLRGFLMSPSGA